jgi:hypothetical protein
MQLKEFPSRNHRGHSGFIAWKVRGQTASTKANRTVGAQGEKKANQMLRSLRFCKLIDPYQWFPVTLGLGV